MKSKYNEAAELSKAIGDFLSDYAPSHLTSSEHTLRSYETALALYIGYLEEACEVTPDKFTKECFDQEHIEKWLKWLQVERNCSADTCNNRLSAFRTFAKYISSHNVKYVSVNTDALNVPYRKTVKKKVQGLTRNAVKAILAEPDTHTKMGLRDVTLLITLYGTAARIDELLSIKIEDIYIRSDKPYIIISGKGQKIRTLYLLPKAVSFLKLYISRFHGSAPCKDDYLFYSSIRGKNSKLSQQAVHKLLHKYAGTAHKKCEDVPLDLHAHQFRHAKATHWLEDGMNIVQISFLLGHSSVETTMVYLDITTEQEMKALATLEDEKNQNVSVKWNPEKDTLSDICGLRKLKK